MKSYAAFYEKARLQSSSGGVFSLIASKFDVIYGVAMTEDCYGCEFVRIEKDINSLRGSKYFQAKMGDTLKKIKQDLLDGRNVLFSGTGCQINGLCSFLGKEYNNLFLLEIICHGVPSPLLWKEYVKFQESRFGKIKSVNFRCKEINTNGNGRKIKSIFISKDEDAFMRMFLNNYCLRPSCYECFAKKNKLSDITIADFWGIDKIAPEMDDGKGISLMIIRTSKGDKLFEQIKDELNYKEVNPKLSIAENPSEFKSAERPLQRDFFYEDFRIMTFKKLANKYVYGKLWRRIARRVKRTIKAVFLSSSKKINQFNYGILIYTENK